MKYRGIKIPAMVLGGVTVLLLLLCLLLQSHAVQTKVANAIVGKASESVAGRIHIGKVRIKFFNRLSLEDVSIVSDDDSEELRNIYTEYGYSDTLCAVKSATATFSLKSLLAKEVRINSLTIDGGVFHLQAEKDGQMNVERILGGGPKKDKPESNTVIVLDRIKVGNFRFTLRDPFRQRGEDEYFTDFADLDVRDITVEATDIRYSADSTVAKVSSISARDKSGFRITRLAGDVRISGKGSIIRNFLLQDGGTDLKGPYLSMAYSSAKSLKYFVDSVKLGISLKDSRIDFRTLSRLSKGLRNSTLRLCRAEGEVTGPIRELRSDRLSVTSESGKSVAMLRDIRIKGLPDSRNTDVMADVESITTTGRDLATVLSDLSANPRIVFFDRIPPLEIFRFRGNLSGRLDNLHAEGTLLSNSNNADISASVDRRTAGKIYVSGRLDAENIDLGGLTGADMLGSLKARTSYRITSGGGTVIEFGDMNVERIGINGHDLRSIKVSGRYSDNYFDGKILCSDPDMRFMFQGQVNTSLKEGSRFKFHVNIPYADLAATGIDSRDSLSDLTVTVNADLEFGKRSGLLGFAKIDNLSYTNSTGSYDIGDIEFKSSEKDGKYVIDFLSDFARARYEGTDGITGFTDKAKELIVMKHFGNLLPEKRETESAPAESVGTTVKQEKTAPGNNYSLTLQTFNTQGVCALLYPGLYIQQGTSLRARISADDSYNITLSSGRLAFRNNYLKNLSLTVNNRDSLIYARLFNKDAVVSGFKVDSTRITARGSDNRIDLSVRFHNDTTGSNNTNLRAAVSFLRDTTLDLGDGARTFRNPVSVTLGESDITLKGDTWRFKPAGMLFADSVIVADGIEIYNGKQSLRADGYLSRTIADSLCISMERFNIAILDQFLDKSMKIHGLISGKANLSMNKNNTRMFASLSGDSMYVNNSLLGDVMLLGKWSQENNRYNLLARTTRDGNTHLNIDGYYRPSDNHIDIQTSLDDLSLTYFEPFLTSVINNMGGSMNGRIHAYGPLDKIVLEGENCSFSDFRFTLDYTKVPYTLNGPIEINQSGIRLLDDIITDSYGGRGILSGGVTYRHFKDIKADVRIALNNIHALNTTEKENEDFYGTAFASGNVTLTGTSDKLNIGVNATTQQKTFVHIPITGASKATRTNILTFKQIEKEVEIDPYDTIYLSKKDVRTPMELAVNLQINATPDADLWLEVDKSTGDIVKARGNGRIGINVNPKRGIFDLSGNYKIAGGSYRFVLMGLATRDFEVEEGSSVTFNGPVDNTTLDLTALYKTKTSINRLISDTSSVATIRSVISSIIVKGKLANPEIKFKIDVPDLDPTTKVKVESALNSEDKIQKQFAALIASGGFIPDAQSGVSSNSTMLYSNATEMLSNQLNSIFMQLGIPLDLGLNYQSGDNSKNDAFDVAVSTQLFNNRVIINGNIGNNPYDNDGRDVKGNIDIEVKLDSKGKVRLTLFSHATDRYSNYLDESQRTGLGIAYQHEFNSFKDLFRKKSAQQKEFEKMLKERQRQKRKAERAARKSASKLLRQGGFVRMKSDD